MYIISDDIYIEAPCAIGAYIAFSQPFRLGAYSHLNGGFIKDVSIGRYCSIERDVQFVHGFHPDNWRPMISKELLGANVFDLIV